MRRPLALVVALGLPALGLAELAAHGVVSARAPGFDAYAGLAGPVAEMRRPGDKVITAPAWAEVLVRSGLGDDGLSIAEVAELDVRFAPAVIEISVLGRRDARVAGFREVEKRSVGKFELRRLENPAPIAKTFDFVAALGPKRARVAGTQPELACAWTSKAQLLSGGLGGHPTFPEARFECPGGPFFNVSSTVIADEEFRPRRCIWAHPTQHGARVITFERVRLGSVIAGGSGLYWMIEREKKGAPITLRVKVDGDDVGAVVHRDGEGFAPFELPLGAHAGAAAATVEFAVSAANYAHRHFCFEAHSR